jgi:hypothetical protein
VLGAWACRTAAVSNIEQEILNDCGKPYLYRPHLFEVIDSNEPTIWITEYGDDG